MGRTRVSPEDSNFQVVSQQLGAGDSDLSSSSNSSTIPSTASSTTNQQQQQQQQQGQTAGSNQDAANTRIIKIRFLQDLPAAEQQKYNDEQLKKQVEKRAALSGHLLYIQQQQKTGENVQDSAKKSEAQASTTTTATTQPIQAQQQQQSADSTAVVTSTVEPAVLPTAAATTTTAADQQQQQVITSAPTLTQQQQPLTAVSQPQQQQYDYQYSNSSDTNYGTSQQQYTQQQQQLQLQQQLSNGSVPGYSRYPPEYTASASGYPGGRDYADTGGPQVFAQRNSYTRNYSFYIGADGYTYNAPNSHVPHAPPSYASATSSTGDYNDHLQAAEARYERWRSDYHHQRGGGPGRAYRRLPNGSAAAGPGSNAWTRDPRIAEAAYRRFTVEQQIRYGILPPRDGLIAAGVTVTSEHTVVEDRMYYRDSRFYESNGSVSTGRAASYQLDAGRLQDQDTAALLGHDQQPNGHVTALPKTPTICQQMNGHGNIPGAEGGEENSHYEYATAPMAGLPMIGAIMGMCLGGPVGFLAGVKIGGLAAVGGSILGYTGASVVSEHREIRDYIDEHYQNKPELYVQTPKEEAAAMKQRRSSRQLPELPGSGTSRLAIGAAGSGGQLASRPIGPAGLKTGPNGRPSLVRLSSQDRFILARSSSVDQRSSLVKQNSVDGHRPRLLPQRPPLLRGNSSSEILRSYKSAAASSAVQRRISFQRQSSTSSVSGSASGLSNGYYSSSGGGSSSSHRTRFTRQASTTDINHHSAAANSSNTSPQYQRVLPNLRSYRRGYGDQSDMEKQSMMALIAANSADAGGNSAQELQTSSSRHSTANGTVANGGIVANGDTKSLTNHGCDSNSGVVSTHSNGGFWSGKRQSNGYQRLDSADSRQSRRHHQQYNRQTSVQE